MAIFISVLALLATFFQAYLQHVHNQKSVKPIGQIDLRDLQGHVFVAISNNGVGPLIIEKVEYLKGDETYARLNNLLELGLNHYDNVVVATDVIKVVYPGSQLRVFEASFDRSGSDSLLDQTRLDLSHLTVRITAKDIYDNKIIVSRNLDWFSRHTIQVSK